MLNKVSILANCKTYYLTQKKINKKRRMINNIFFIMILQYISYLFKNEITSLSN